jgi:DNA-binding transcriptional MerR regulator
MRIVKPEPVAAMLEIGDVARQAELSIDTVRLYEREGLVGRVRRSTAGRTS